MDTEYFFWEGKCYKVTYEPGRIDRQFVLLPDGNAVWFSFRSGSNRVIETAPYTQASRTRVGPATRRGSFKWDFTEYFYPYDLPLATFLSETSLRTVYFLLENDIVLRGAYRFGALEELGFVGIARRAEVANTVTVKLDGELFAIPVGENGQWYAEIRGCVYEVYDTGYEIKLIPLQVLPSMERSFLYLPD